MSGVPSSSGLCVPSAAAGQARLDVLDALEAEPADQPAGETGQARDLRHRVRGAQAFDFGEGIVDARGFRRSSPSSVTNSVWPRERVHAPRRQADDRVAPEALAALDRFEQVGVRAVGELQVDRQRRVEVGQDLAHDRDAGVAGLRRAGGTVRRRAACGVEGNAAVAVLPARRGHAVASLKPALWRAPAALQRRRRAAAEYRARRSSGQVGGRCMRRRRRRSRRESESIRAVRHPD